MLALLLIVSAFIVGYAIDCPPGTKQVGPEGARGAYQGYSARMGRFPIGWCKYYCERLGERRCKSFTFDNNYRSSTGVAGISKCVPYRTVSPRGAYPDSHPASDQLLCQLPPKGAALRCPLGTAQVGGEGALGSFQAASVKHGMTIVQCKDYCEKGTSGRCKSFTFDDNSGKDGKTLCIPYRGDSQRGKFGDSHPRGDQLLCALEDTPECPSRTKQIGRTGSYFMAAYLRFYTDKSKEYCRDRCVRYRVRGRKCTAFAYDSDNGADNASPSLCRLYDADTRTRRRQMPPGHPNDDQILCGVLGKYRGSYRAESPGIFSIDGVLDDVSVVDENGAMQISVNYIIIYVVIGLVLVNIICLVVNCWRKMKRGKGKYKIVSMRSDEDTDVEHQ